MIKVVVLAYHSMDARGGMCRSILNVGRNIIPKSHITRCYNTTHHNVTGKSRGGIHSATVNGSDLDDAIVSKHVTHLDLRGTDDGFISGNEYHMIR
jgi:hypothetical protein